MNKLFLMAAGLIAMLLISSCEIEKPDRYFEIDEVRHDLQTGLMDDWGTNTSGVVDTRRYAVSLRSSEAFPSNYITFLIGSTSTTKLQEGNYYYDLAADKGEFSDMRIGVGLDYDNNGDFTSGINFSDVVANYDGVIRISRASNGNYDFFFDIKIIILEDARNNFPKSEYQLNGEYNGSLTIDTYDVDLNTY